MFISKLLWNKLTVISLLKLFLMPFLAFLCVKSFGVESKFLIPILILLASPSAVVTYVLANQIGGAPKMASANVSIQTLFCAISYSLIIGLFKLHV
jgi:predicted permease